jgi:D-alanyl-D-alanine carboxypeptidase
MKVLLGALLALALLAAPARASRIVLVEDGHHVTSHGAIKPDDRFRVGSITKTFVAVTVLQLEAEGRLSLEDRIDRYVPGAGAAPLRTLLNHTSGIPNHAEDPRTYEGWPLRQWRPDELVAIALSMPPVTGFHYSNTNYVLLGMAVEKITGRPLAAELERRIIRPLRLKRTAYDEGPRVRGVVPGSSDGTDYTISNTSWAGASGALVSTARDLARFYGSLRTLLPRKQYRAMHTGTYGYGLFPVRTACGTAWGHNGAVPGYFSNAFTLRHRTAVTLVNRYPTDEQAAVRNLARALCR